jgi:hypothetical protein
MLNECADVLATPGILNKPHQSDTPQVTVPVGDDDGTDSTEYVLEDGEETLSQNRREAYRPEHTYVWVDRDQVSVCPPLMLGSCSGAYYSHIADHPADSFLGPCAASVAPVSPEPEVTIVSESETEPGSDILSPVPRIIIPIHLLGLAPAG